MEGEKRFKCSECGESFKSEKDLRTHTQSTHEANRYAGGMSGETERDIGVGNRGGAAGRQGVRTDLRDARSDEEEEDTEEEDEDYDDDDMDEDMEEDEG